VLLEVSSIVRSAHKRGIPVSAHVTRSRHLKFAIENGVDDVDHMIFDDLPDEYVTRMIEKEIYWVPTLELWKGVGLIFKKPLDIVIENLRRFKNAGGKVALGTDFNGYDCEFDLGMPMTEIELMQKAGMTPMQVIVAGTKHGAHVCNLDHELGTIEKGKIADIIVVEGNPLNDIQLLQNSRIVIHNGEIIRRDRY